MDAGRFNTSGSTNSFFGYSAGNGNTSASENSFFGAFSGFSNTTGIRNSYFGFNAGKNTTSGANNVFIGHSAGFATTTGTGNVFLGLNAGNFNTTGNANIFIGAQAGIGNTIGVNNTIVGNGANVTANNLNHATAIGADAAVSSDNTIMLGRASGADTVVAPGVLQAATVQAVDVNASGKLQGSNFSTFLTNTFTGLSAGTNNSGFSNSFFGYNAGNANTSGKFNTFIGKDAGLSNTTGSSNTLIGESTNVGAANLDHATAIGADAVVSTGNTIALGRANGADTVLIPGKLKFNSSISATNNGVSPLCLDTSNQAAICAPEPYGYIINAQTYPFTPQGASIDITGNIISGGLVRGTNVASAVQFTALGKAQFNDYVTILNGAMPQGGDQQLCRNSSTSIISYCSSSLRYKINIANYSGGLNVINRLRPITFDWKQGGKRDLGFGAEDVEKIDPLLVTHNDDGSVQGVKYDRITAALVNAVKEQQELIEQQQEQINVLKKLLCLQNPHAEICQKKK